jgi:single-stranded DNA-specific DHH superfamily exonuclease
VTHYDVFNGDADGICALHQLRLERPLASVLVTGVKRDIALLQRVPAQAGDSVTVLDLSAAVNHDALVALLARGVRVGYFDHHHPGELPASPLLEATIDTRPAVCTSMLVDRHLGGRRQTWAIVAAFGDNLAVEARGLAARRGIAAAEVAVLQELGEALAYNAYGETIADLVIDPAALYRLLAPYDDPLRFRRAESVVDRIVATQRDDLARAFAVGPQPESGQARVHVLPDAAWSRRVHGALANRLANAEPRRAHAVVAPNTRGSYTVSVRAPLVAPTGADALCRAFASGGGRAAAAGISALPREALPEFVRALEHAFP